MKGGFFKYITQAADSPTLIKFRGWFRNDPLPWMYIRHLPEASNLTADDVMWTKTQEGNVPCFSNTLNPIPKTKCGVMDIRQATTKPNAIQKMQWGKAWLIIFDIQKAQRYDPYLFQTVRNMCKTAFAYHCRGTTSIVDMTYIESQFALNSHIMIVVADCVGSDPSPTPAAMYGGDYSDVCKFMVLGFMFLNNLHNLTTSILPKVGKNVSKHSATRVTGPNLPEDISKLYIDIICTRLGIGNIMMDELLTDKHTNMWQPLVFQGAQVTSYMCYLRAVPGVYTYYPMQYGFSRTLDSVTRYPIFSVEIRALREQYFKEDNTASDDDILTKAFGPSLIQHINTTQLVWKKSDVKNVNVYQLNTPEAKAFFKMHNLAKDYTKRSKVFHDLAIFTNDNRTNGYLYGKLVEGTSMRGGRYLGEGTYGCTLEPAPTCIDSEQHHTSMRKRPKPPLVGKIFTSTSAAIEEWATATALAKIDPNQEFTVYPLAHCRTSERMIKAVGESDRCEIMRSDKTQAQPIDMLEMPNGGVTLDTFVAQNRPSPDMVAKVLLPVFRGMQKLVRHGIVHQDLKFDNILYSPEAGRARIIDFGLQVPLRNALSPSKNPYIASNYWLHPPEYKVITFMQQGEWQPMTTQSILKIIKGHLATLQLKFSSTDKRTLYELLLNGGVYSKKEYVDAYTRFVEQMLLKKQKRGMLAYLQKHPNRIDVYSLGITLMYLTSSMTMTNTRTKKAWFDLLRDMLHPNPAFRASFMKCHKQLKAIAAAYPA